MKFQSKIRRHTRVWLDDLRSDLKNETMFFGASVDLVQSRRDAPITDRVARAAVNSERNWAGFAGSPYCWVYPN